MEVSRQTQKLSRTDLEQFGRQLISEFKKELDGFRDQLISEMKNEQEAFRVKLLAEVKEHTKKSDIVPTIVSNRKEGSVLSQENTWNSLPLVPQPAKQEQSIRPSGEITHQKPRKKRTTAIQQERLAMVIPLSNKACQCETDRPVP